MSELEMIEASCKVCTARFKYFGKPQWYCSTFCRNSDPDNAGEKRAGEAWHREKNRTFQVSLQKKQAKEHDISLQARGDHQNQSSQEEKKTASATGPKIKKKLMPSDDCDTGSMMNTGREKTSAVERTIKPIARTVMPKERNTEGHTQSKKMPHIESGITNTRTLNMTSDTKENSKQVIPTNSSQLLEVSKTAVSDSIEALSKSGSAIMERLEEAREKKNTQMVCQCAKELRETIRTSLELSKFVYTVSKKD